MKRPRTIGKKTHKGRTQAYHFRCSPEFRGLIEKVIEVRKDDCHELWSGSDVIHLAVQKLAKEMGVKNVPEKL